MTSRTPGRFSKAAGPDRPLVSGEADGGPLRARDRVGLQPEPLGGRDDAFDVLLGRGPVHDDEHGGVLRADVYTSSPSATADGPRRRFPMFSHPPLHRPAHRRRRRAPRGRNRRRRLRHLHEGRHANRGAREADRAGESPHLPDAARRARSRSPSADVDEERTDKANKEGLRRRLPPRATRREKVIPSRQARRSRPCPSTSGRTRRS